MKKTEARNLYKAWKAFFDGPLGHNEMEVFLGEQLITKIHVHPGVDDKTMNMNFTQDYQHMLTDSGICVGIEEAQRLVAMLNALIDSRGVKCEGCDAVMHDAYENGLCYDCFTDIGKKEKR